MIHLASMKETAELKMQLAQKNAENQKLKAQISLMNESVKEHLGQLRAEHESVKAHLGQLRAGHESVKTEMVNVPLGPASQNKIKLSVNGNDLTKDILAPANKIEFKVNGK